ncbi:hypothetical protein PYW07_002139 [Mythimna separata]|uniref:CLIP domain-containing serine protease n=1 Tax=Mythimna separata TaxID=271217 RepID=A0AAD7YNL7_MYTSE|nr:hypothetical protein PYW07_002139 [Mythimna separata]
MWNNLSVLFVTTLLWSLVLSQSETCVTPLGRQSVCVSLYKCPTLLKAIEQGASRNSMVSSFLKGSLCGFQGDIPKVCCGPLPSAATQEQTQRLTQALAQGSISYNQEDSSPAPRNQCGVDTSGDRIYGGVPTELNEFPWMALLGYKNSTGTITYQCGGSLINRRYILTAAHCITGAIVLEYGILSTVRLGEYDTRTDVDCVGSKCADRYQEISVASAYPHPAYIYGTMNRKDDIGIVRLATRAEYTYYVQPICLVDNTDRLKTGDNVYVAGWGKPGFGVKKSPIKMKIRLSIFDKDACVSKYRRVGALLGENQFCAGGVFLEDTCRGDSGGPLMKRRPEGIWEAYGVISFGSDVCGSDGWPGVYTSVARYMDWIMNTLKTSNVPHNNNYSS